MKSKDTSNKECEVSFSPETYSVSIYLYDIIK